MKAGVGDHYQKVCTKATSQHLFFFIIRMCPKPVSPDRSLSLWLSGLIKWLLLQNISFFFLLFLPVIWLVRILFQVNCKRKRFYFRRLMSVCPAVTVRVSVSVFFFLLLFSDHRSDSWIWGVWSSGRCSLNLLLYNKDWTTSLHLLQCTCNFLYKNT